MESANETTHVEAILDVGAKLRIQLDGAVLQEDRAAVQSEWSAALLIRYPRHFQVRRYLAASQRRANPPGGRVAFKEVNLVDGEVLDVTLKFD